MRKKRDPLKQIMSDVHKDARAGDIDLGDHGGFVAEVRRRARAAGLAEDELHGIVSPERHGLREERERPPS
jgi:hypothetical protein